MTNNFLFDLVAPLYDHVIGFDTTSALIPLLDLHGTERLLDAGGGTGRITQVIAPHTRETLIADLSLPMLKQAREKRFAALTNTSTVALPFANSTFDRILVVDALHHFPDQSGTLTELWRVLKPGGRIVIEEPNIHKFGVKLVALGEKVALMGSHFNTPETIAEMLTVLPLAKVIVEIGKAHAAWIIADKQAM
ncbi:MAG: class I SAM-dependent methyltransferase [Anaerolineae bacterium]|jgi:demethylmenaquinone methyltransferase/2-methoxy-6-polyprenyl-1,4-benzoquinol methylase|nr:class I SAM-dependent methyltransferase [Anaerolineae bacterium]